MGVSRDWGKGLKKPSFSSGIAAVDWFCHNFKHLQDLGRPLTSVRPEKITNINTLPKSDSITQPGGFRMKRPLWIHFLSAGAIALIGATIFPQPSHAQIRFLCGFSDEANLYTTYAQTPRGNIPVIRWNSYYFEGSGYTPERRCQEVSSRFQNLHSQNMLSSITAGYLNGQPVICAGSRGGCTSGNLLFTLKSGSDSASVLQQLFDVRAGASATPLYQSSNGSGVPTIDMNQYLKNAPVENARSRTSEPAPTPRSPAPIAPPPSNGALW
jgi:hypothetical protein